MTLNANILLSLVANETDAGDYAKDVRTTKVEYFKELTDGTGANQATLVWSDAGSFDDIYYPTGIGFTISDERGAGAFSSIKMIYIRNVGDINMSWIVASEWSTGPVSSASGASEIAIKPGGALLYIAPDSDGWLTSGGRLALGCDPELFASYEVVLIGEGTIT